jgi:hypothetical protein
MRPPLLFLIILGLFASRCGFGQASFLFRNLNGDGNVDAPVFDAGGVPLEGPRYLAELYGGATSDSLTPLVLFETGNRLIKPFATQGYVVPVDGGSLVVESVLPRGSAWLQMRAWDSRLGATYEAAVTQGMGGYGESPIFYAQGGDPYDMLGGPEPLIGLQSFSLRPVPEPATWALLAVGAFSMIFVVRRWRC